LVTWFSIDFFRLFHPCGFDSFKKGASRAVPDTGKQENAQLENSRLDIESPPSA